MSDFVANGPPNPHAVPAKIALLEKQLFGANKRIAALEAAIRKALRGGNVEDDGMGDFERAKITLRAAVRKDTDEKA